MTIRNVLQLVSSFHQGGSERQAVQLARLLRDSGRYRVHIACLSGEGVLRPEANQISAGEIAGFPLTSFYNRNFTRQLARFVRFVREREIEVVNTHDFYTNVFGIAGAALAGVPARIAARRETKGTRTPMQKKVERAVYRLSHAIVANAEAVRADLIDEGVPDKKINVIYNGLDVERVSVAANLSRPELLTRANLPPHLNCPLVTIIANINLAVKDHPTFLRAARRVADALPETAFVLAGEGELIPQIKTLAADLGLADSVFFTGRCEHVAELLAASSVCVLSSQAEGFSNSILEYMAAARPVVATDVGGAREAITNGETGFIVAVGDDETMARRIVELLKDKEQAATFGARGREKVLARFSCAAQLAATEKLYDSLLDQTLPTASRLQSAR